MGLTDNLDIRQVASVYLFANTPMYLYRHLREIDSVRDLGKDVSLKDLVDEYDRRTLSKGKSVEDIAIAYTLLVAITFWEYREALEALSKFELSRLDWGSDVKDIFISKSPITTLLELSVKPTFSPTEQMKSNGSTSTLRLDFN